MSFFEDLLSNEAVQALMTQTGTFLATEGLEKLTEVVEKTETEADDIILKAACKSIVAALEAKGVPDVEDTELPE